MSTAVLEYGGVLRERWRWIVWGLLLTLGATTLFLLVRPPLYRSEATVFVRTPGDVSQVLDGGDSYAQARARTYAALADSTNLVARVIADNGLNLTPELLSERIKAANPQGTALIDVAISAPSAEEVERTATVFLSEYAAMARTLESVPGSLVPRAEFVVVNPPGAPIRVVAWGASIPVVLLCAVLIGLFLGSIGAVLRSIFDPSVRDPRDASRISRRPVLGSIGGGRTAQVTVDERVVAHRLLSVMGNPDRGVITVTEPEHSSATTTTAVFLAFVLAERNTSVVLVDLDVHSAETTDRLSDRDTPGVADVLGGHTTLAEATLNWAHGRFLGAGSATKSTADLIDSTALRTLIAELRELYGWVILACPSATDAGVIADGSDLIALAVRKDVTTEEQLRQTSIFLPKEPSSVVIFDRGHHPARIELYEPDKERRP